MNPLSNRAWMDFANVGRQFFTSAIRYMDARTKEMEKENNRGELLTALADTLTMIEHVVEDGYHYEGSTEIIDEAKEAIAKARGENQ